MAVVNKSLQDILDEGERRQEALQRGIAYEGDRGISNDEIHRARREFLAEELSGNPKAERIIRGLPPFYFVSAIEGKWSDAPLSVVREALDFEQA